VVAAARLLGEGVHSWGAAVTAVRVPSVVLVVVAFAAEVVSGSASSVLLYARSGDVLWSDYVLALACVMPMWAYVGLYGYQVTWGMRVDVVPVEPTGGGASLDDSDEDDGDDYRQLEGDRAQRVNPSGRQRLMWRRVLAYALEPTHVPCVKGHGLADQDINFAVDVDLDIGEQWLRRNYYFIADRRWAAYGAIEVAVGSIVDVIDGIPMTTRNPAACIGRPAAMVVLLTGLLVALVWKKPYSVRLQLWTAFVVVVLMLGSSILVMANVILVDETLDSTAAGLMAVAGLIICIFSALDVLLVMLTLVPALRRLLGLRASSLWNSIASIRKRANHLAERLKFENLLRAGDNEGVLSSNGGDEPMILIDSDEEEELADTSSSVAAIDQDAKSNSSRSLDTAGTTMVEDDEAAVQRMILDDIEEYVRNQYCADFFNRKVSSNVADI
jgi:hypothetical protein